MKKVCILIGLLLIGQVAYAGTFSRQTTWTTGGSFTAAEINGEFDHHVSGLNDGLDNDNADTTNGYRFYEVVSSQPTYGTEGRLIYLTTTNKLYTDVGASWVEVTSAIIRHYRTGFTLKQGSTADSDIIVRPGIIDVGGTTVTAVADSASIAIGTAGNWKDGTAAADTTDTWIYVYINKDGTIKLDENAPAYSYIDETTATLPLRYHKQSTTYYRCLGAVYQDADSDLCWGQASSEGRYVSQFDAANMCEIGGLGTGADQTFNTIWTPKYIKVMYAIAGTPADGGDIRFAHATKLMLTAAWDATVLNASNDSDDTNSWIDGTAAGCVKAVTSQSAGTSGSFTIHAMADGYFFYAVAYRDEI